MFRSYASAVPFLPYNGLKVILAGRVSLYEKTGEYQIYAEQMFPEGKGALALAFEQLKAKLEAEGLFSPEHKRPLPFYPERIAVITSPTGAAVRDIIQIARRRNPHVELIVVPALVQGAEAAASLVRAIQTVNEWGGADVIILGRGGGSQEDLWPFNEEITARAVYASKIPVISAVGHETDFSITDFVADRRALTPSAAAELAVPVWRDLDFGVKGLFANLRTLVDRRLDEKKSQLETQLKRGIHTKALNAVLERERQTDNLLEKLNRTMDEELKLEKMRLSNNSERLEGLSPIKVLRRGYTAVFDAAGKQIGSAAELTAGQTVSVKFHDGQRSAEIRD
jgi:exodeoxyribonuclease VII large subunit